MAAGALAEAKAAHVAGVQQLMAIHDAALQAAREEASGLHAEVSVSKSLKVEAIPPPRRCLQSSEAYGLLVTFESIVRLSSWEQKHSPHIHVRQLS